MHLPNRRVYDEMRCSEASIWFVPANDGSDIALLIKLPTAQVKAIVNGCPVTIVLRLIDSTLYVAARVFDIPGTPLITTKLQRTSEEHQALIHFLSVGRVPFFLFNEMDYCVASSEASIDRKQSEQATRMLSVRGQLYIGKKEKEHDLALDELERTTTFGQESDIELALEVSKWNASDVTFIGLNETQDIKVDNRQEGELLERLVWASLESVFPTTLRKSPQVQTGKKRRELTDVMASYERGAFLFEAKALSEYTASAERSLERRISSIQQHIEKALKQLVGAGKAIDRGDELFDCKGNNIEIERTNPPHGIVLVSELIEHGNWYNTVESLSEALANSRMFIHILDLRELITILKICRGNRELLDYNLIERCKKFVELRNIFIRSRDASNKAN